MYVIDRKGSKYDLPEDADFRFMQNTTVFDTDVKLVTKWVAYFNKFNHETSEYDYVKEILFDHKPTDEELLYHMGQLGLSYNDYVEVSKVKSLKWAD
jgi:hypothetical protein